MKDADRPPQVELSEIFGVSAYSVEHSLEVDPAFLDDDSEEDLPPMDHGGQPLLGAAGAACADKCGRCEGETATRPLPSLVCVC